MPFIKVMCVMIGSRLTLDRRCVVPNHHQNGGAGRTKEGLAHHAVILHRNVIRSFQQGKRACPIKSMAHHFSKGATR